MSYLGTKPQTATQLANSVVTTESIADGAVTPSDLSTGHPNWDTSGNVGIGTASPVWKLDVYNGSGSSYGRFQTGSSTDEAGVELKNTAGSTYIYKNVNTNNLAVWINGADRLKVDSAGRVTMPYQPAFEARMNTSGGSVTVGGAIATFNNIRVNTGSHFSGTRFTAPVTGNYQFGGIGATYSNSTFRMDIYANGSFYQIGCEHNDGVVWTIKGWSTVIRLNAGDYIEIKINGTVNQEWTSFSGHLIG